MHLKSLILRGFKSFADKTALSLEPGVTVIVGPNGSGKSNISDAILWVLGEQSARSLRGGSMEDVIFAGSAGRDPVGIAEVSLVLDNSDHALPIEFSEVTVSRRVFRSGESEYMINNSPCRLLDVQELLSDSGLGRDTSSIISQGGLDDTVNCKPEERRILIEEAAAIVKHRKRKERAAKKLDVMEGNLLRARDVLGEVSRQLRPLERQARAAEEYDTLAKELRDGQIALAVLELREIKGEWEKLIVEEESQVAELEELRRRFMAEDEKVTSLQGALEAKGVYAGDLGEHRRRLQGSLERINSGLLLLEEKGKNLIERASDLRAKIHHSESKLASLRREMKRIQDEQKTADAQLQALYANLADERRTAETVKKRRLAASEAVEQLSGGISHNKAVLADNQKEIQSLKGHVKSLSLQKEFLSAREASVAKRLEGAGSKLADARGSESKAVAALESRRAKLEAAQIEIDRVSDELSSSRDERAARAADIAELRAKTGALEELSKPFAAASPALAWLLSQEHKISGLVGMVGDLISVRRGYEKVIEVALGSDLFCVVTKDALSTRKALDFLREKKAGEIAFIPASQAKAPPVSMNNDPHAGEPAVRFVKCRPGAKNVLAVLLSDTYVADTLDDAIKAARTEGARYVTRQGEIAWPNGKISLGALPEGGAGMLLRRRELAEMRTGLKRLETAQAATHKTVAALQSKLEKAQGKAVELVGKAQAAEDTATEASAKVRVMDADMDRMGKEKTSLAKELARVAIELRREEPQSGRLSKENTRIERELISLEKKLVAAKTEHDERYREELEKGQMLSQCQVDIASLTERGVYVKRRERTLAAEIDELETTGAQEQGIALSLDRLQERIKPVHDMYSTLLTSADSWSKELAEQAANEQSDAQGLRERLHEAQEGARGAGARIETSSATVAELRVAKGQLEMRVNAAVKQIVDEYHIPIEQALKRPVDASEREKLEQTVRALRGKASRLGAVNPIAMEEYRRLNERREFLTAQVEDLTRSKTALARVIEAIDRKMRDQFMATFEDVNRHFQSVFAILFPGGRAELFLTDPDDPFETGVDIEAQPSGKKLQKMSLLSGGERALVATALLFALHHTRPSPFYVLDEVEAALDDLNLQRFIGLLQNLRTKTQFVVITHQRRTMEVADCLYGVSMQADGVSKLVSQRLPAKEAS